MIGTAVRRRNPSVTESDPEVPLKAIHSSASCSESPARAPLPSVLLKDSIVRLMSLVLAVVAIPYFWPGLSPEARAAWAVVYTDPFLLLVCLLAFQYRLHRLADPAERRFWNLWTLALCAWLAKSGLTFWFESEEIWTLESDLILNGCYFFFYSFAAIALETQPQAASSRLARFMESPMAV